MDDNIFGGWCAKNDHEDGGKVVLEWEAGRKEWFDI